MKIKLTIVAVVLAAIPFFSIGQSYTEGFEDVSSLSDWYIINNSVSPNTTWVTGNDQIFNAYAGTSGSYISVNYNSTSSSTSTTLSNWLFTPTRTYNNGDVISFYTRIPAVSPVYPDRLEVRFSSDGNGINVGNSATSVGTFTNVLLTVNPSLNTTDYPQDWAQYTIIISGLSGPTNGRVALRYFVTNGGPSGPNSNYIGIDSYSYTSSIPPPSNDECVNAILINQGVSCIGTAGSTAYASESLPGCSGVANDDVWYKFTPSGTSASVTVNGSTNFDAVYEVFSGGSCGNLTSLTCSDAFLEGESEYGVINNLVPGQNYYVRVYDSQDNIANTMTFDICVEGFTQCNLNQPSGAFLENEICSEDNNGGCYSNSTSFYNIVGCNQTIFGNAWADNGNRDNDYYRFQIGEAGTATWNATAEFPFTISFFDVSDCSNPIELTTESFNACQTGSISFNFPSAGTYAAFIAPTSFLNYPCGSYNDYVVNLVIATIYPTINSAGNTAICPNSSVVLSTTSPAGTYQWLRDGQIIPNETANSITASQGGIYTLNYTNINGCSSTSLQGVTVSVLPLDDAGFSYPSNTVCLGSQNTIPTTAVSGVFSSNSSDLVFSNATTGEIDVINSTEGTYQITFTTNAICPNTSTQTFSISPSLNANFSYSNTVYCKSENNQQVILANGASIGVFSSTNGISLNAQTGEINLSTSIPGAYTITNTIAASGTCLQASATFNLTINGTDVVFPTIGTVCQNATPFNLVAIPSGGIFSGNGVTNNQFDPSQVQGNSMVTYMYVDVNNCMNMQSQMVIIEAIPTVTFGAIGPFCVYNNTFQITNVSPSGGTFIGQGMSSPNNFNPGNAGIGTHSIVYTVTQNGCSSSANQSVDVQECAGVSELSVAYKAYPNPTNSVLYIDSEGQLFVSIFSLDGRKLMDKVKTDASHFAFDMSTLAKGQYILMLSNENSSTIQKIILE